MMKRIICAICGNEIEVQQDQTCVECSYCGHMQKVVYDMEAIVKELELAKSIFGNDIYMTNPEIVSRIQAIAKELNVVEIVDKCTKILEILPKKNEELYDSLVMEIANSLDTVNNHFSELTSGQKKVADATTRLQEARNKLASKAMSIQIEIDSTGSITNIDLFKGKKIEALKKNLISVEQEIRELDNKMSDISQGWSRLYLEKLMEIVKAQNNVKVIKNRIKALEDSKAVSGSILSLDDCHYLNLMALSNNLSGLIKGSIITFGKYKGEPLLWKVLAINNDRVLVLSENVIEVGPYHQGSYVVKGYEGSDIRKWLNEQLIYSLFTEAEIQSVDKIGEDRIFLLEASQVEFMFNSDQERMAAPTAYAIAKGVDLSVYGKQISASYWLKTINEATMNKFAYTVEADGTVSKSIGVVNINTYGIRPALWLSIKK